MVEPVNGVVVPVYGVVVLVVPVNGVVDAVVPDSVDEVLTEDEISVEREVVGEDVVELPVNSGVVDVAVLVEVVPVPVYGVDVEVLPVVDVVVRLMLHIKLIS